MARTNGGINKRVRYKILEYIKKKIESKEGIIKKDKEDYVKISLKEFTECVNWRNKSAISKILKYMESNGIIQRIDTGKRIKYSKYNQQAYKIAKHLERKETKSITIRELYPTRNYNALRALEIFITETHQPKDIKVNRRTFIRIATIMKDIFKWDLNRFRHWCKWIYINGKKNTRKLLRTGKTLSIFITKRFKNIYAKYEKLYKISNLVDNNTVMDKNENIVFIKRTATERDYHSLSDEELKRLLRLKYSSFIVVHSETEIKDKGIMKYLTVTYETNKLRAELEARKESQEKIQSMIIAA